MTIDEAILGALGADSRATKASNADRVAAFRRALAEAGYCVVPREPTIGMIEAFYQAHATSDTVFATAEQCYRAMISASEW